MVTLTFVVHPDGDVSAEMDISPGVTGPAADTVAGLLADMSATPRLAAVVRGLVESAEMPRGFGSRLLSALRSAAGPAVSPLDVL